MKKIQQQGFSGIEIILVMVVVGLIGGLGYYVYQKGQTFPAASTSNTSPTTTTKPAEKKPTIPDGFVEYENKDLKIAFAYPKTWGTASAGPSVESAHLSSGSEVTITFSANSSVTAGLVSKDRQHDPNQGHGGQLYAGAYSNAKFDNLAASNPSVLQLKDDTSIMISTIFQTESCFGVGTVLVHQLKDNTIYPSIAFLYIDSKADPNEGEPEMCKPENYKKYVSADHVEELKKVNPTIQTIN